MNTAIIRYAFVSAFPNERTITILDESEKARANKFILVEDRQRYITGRAVLKILLSPLLALDAEEIRFVYSPNGKPMLPGMNPIQFNVSHSGDMIVWGIANGSAIGVDVEHKDNEIAVDQWTTNEATLKALGSRIELSASPLLEVEKRHWTVRNFNLPRDYRCAVAIRSKMSIDIKQLNF